MTDSLRVYVACLAAYNNGKLHGEWIDVGDADELQEEIDAMLAKSPEPRAEEWAIHDIESPVSFGLGEYESLADLVAFAELLDDCEATVLEAATNCWCRSEGPDVLREWVVERFRGDYESQGEYAEEVTSECNPIPEFLACYIDWKAMERDMELSGDITVIRASDHRLYVFSNHG